MNPDFSSETVYLGEMRGYRYWRRNPETYRTIDPERLYSTSSLAPWDESSTAFCCDGLGKLVIHTQRSPEVRAVFPHPHDICKAPCVDCVCGLYAFYDPETAETGIRPYNPIDYDTLIFGVAAASGRIIPGTKGFRAENARILAVVHDAPLPAYPNVKIFNTKDALIGAFPPQPWERP